MEYTRFLPTNRTQPQLFEIQIKLENHINSILSVLARDHNLELNSSYMTDIKPLKRYYESILPHTRFCFHFIAIIKLLSGNIVHLATLFPKTQLYYLYKSYSHLAMSVFFRGIEIYKSIYPTYHLISDLEANIYI